MIAARLDFDRPESKIVVDGIVDMAPSDPLTHYAAAAILEKTFDANDLKRSLAEYQTAAQLAPYNYLNWLNLGRARDLTGDTDGASAAYSRAMELAPNYSYVQWLCGNFALRQGKTAEGFALIAKAAASNPDYAQPAVLTALQIFDADVNAVRRSLGDNAVTNGALTTNLAGQKHFDEAVDAWSHLKADDTSINYKKLGEALVSQLVVAKKFELASRVTSDMLPADAEKLITGKVANGGFENGVKLRNAGTFEWQIADGGEPQVGMSDTTKKNGKFALSLAFNSFDTSAFRTIAQTVAVVPGAEYELEVFYRSDVKTNSRIKWEVADASTTAAITSTPPIAPAADWTSLKVVFKVPAGVDGIILRLTRDGCGGPTCPTNGKLLFDDISLRRL